MNNLQTPKQTRGRNDLLRYAGLGGQIFVSLGLAVFAGYKMDNWVGSPIPLLVWILPLAVLSIMIYKLIKDTSKRKNTDVKK
jgi:uncharacterized membrane protein